MEEIEADPKLIKVVIKEPNKEPEVKEIVNSYRNISNICHGLIDFTYLPTDESVDVILNDESLMNGMEPNVVVPESENVWAGPLIFAGNDPETGETISLTDRQIEKVMKYIERNQVFGMSLKGAYIYSKAIGPLQQSQDAMEMEE